MITTTYECNLCGRDFETLDDGIGIKWAGSDYEGPMECIKVNLAMAHLCNNCVNDVGRIAVSLTTHKEEVSE